MESMDKSQRPMPVNAKYGFVKSRLWKSKSKLASRLLLNFCQKVEQQLLSARKARIIVEFE